MPSQVSSIGLVPKALPTLALTLRADRDRHRWILFLIVVAGLGCRVFQLGASPLWGDEAESAINALTILEHGVPTDQYVGDPIFENVMIQTWPESPEFEFKDISYSANGMALYHSWLPLYSIAASFRLFGIHPDPAGLARPAHNLEERNRMTIAARVPSVIFGVFFIFGLYLVSARLHSVRAGLIAASLGAFLAVSIFYSQNARYYSATAAGITFCMWSVIIMSRRARWSDFLLGGVIFSVLFYSHLLSFVLACFLWAIAMIPALLRHGRNVAPRAAAFLAIIGALCLPWLLATGFIQHSEQIPRAWRFMHFPQDLIMPRLLFSDFGILLAVGLLLAAISGLRPYSKFFTSVAASFSPYRHWLLFVYLWLVISYFGFIFNIPVASFWMTRLHLILMPPALICISMILCSIGHALNQSRSLAIAAGGALLFVLVSNYLHPHDLRVVTLFTGQKQTGNPMQEEIVAAVDYLNKIPVSTSTKLFADPTFQLVLTFYTGMPIQSIVPIRRSFLDTYPGDVILFIRESFSRTGPLSPQSLQAAAALAGQPLGEAEASTLSCKLASLRYRVRIGPHVASVDPPVEPVPEFAVNLWKEDEEATVRRLRSEFTWFRYSFPLSANVQISAPSDWWNFFFYFFVDAESRRRHPNYENRIRSGALTVLPCSSFVVFYSPGTVRRRS